MSIPKCALWGEGRSEVLIYSSLGELVKDVVYNFDRLGLDDNGKPIDTGDIEVQGGNYRYGSVYSVITEDSFCVNLLINIPDHCDPEDRKSLFKECTNIAADMAADVYDYYADDFEESPENDEDVMPKKMVNQVARIIYRGLKEYISINGHLGRACEDREDMIAAKMTRRLARLFRHRAPFRLYYLDIDFEGVVSVEKGLIKSIKSTWQS